MDRCFFISNNTIGIPGLSGGDRIYIELARNWKSKIKLTIIGCEEAVAVCEREGVVDVELIKSSSKLSLENVFTLRAVFINFFKKLTNGIIFVLKNKKLFIDSPYVYSVSDFYPDSIPAFLVKLINPKAVWIAAFYLFAPAPWQKDTPYRGKDFLRGFFYWLSQKPIYWIINRYADMVFVTSQPDKNKFITKKRDASKVFVILGWVGLEESTKYLNSEGLIPVDKRMYDACFVGRFHQQKGVLLLVDIWKKVVEHKPTARLAMIGNGPLESEVKRRIEVDGLVNNIELFGFLDGGEKFNIFRQSKIIVHPATFDSGGMAAAEAMAWGLPGVSFGLESLKTYYPRGMIKVPLGDYEQFAQNILGLLSDREYYSKTAKEARQLIIEEWDWHKRASLLFESIFVNK